MNIIGLKGIHKYICLEGLHVYITSKGCHIYICIYIYIYLFFFIHGDIGVRVKDGPIRQENPHQFYMIII